MTGILYIIMWDLQTVGTTAGRKYKIKYVYFYIDILYVYNFAQYANKSIFLITRKNDNETKFSLFDASCHKP